MKRPKYHFLMLIESQRGRSLITLPGQTFGTTPVPEGTLVKDEKNSHRLARARKAGSPGQVFFTTSLRRTTTALWAADVLPLEGHGDLLCSDALDLYQDYLAGRGGAI